MDEKTTIALVELMRIAARQFGMNGDLEIEILRRRKKVRGVTAGKD